MSAVQDIVMDRVIKDSHLLSAKDESDNSEILPSASVCCFSKLAISFVAIVSGYGLIFRLRDRNGDIHEAHSLADLRNRLALSVAKIIARFGSRSRSILALRTYVSHIGFPNPSNCLVQMEMWRLMYLPISVLCPLG